MQSRVICFSFGQFLLHVPVEEATQRGFVFNRALTVADDERNNSSQQRPVRLLLTPMEAVLGASGVTYLTLKHFQIVFYGLGIQSEQLTECIDAG